MLKSKTFWGGLLILVVLFAASIPSAETVKTLKIGGVGPLTGGAATFGQSTKNGFVMAIEEVNAQGGLQVGKEKYKIEWVYEDDEGKPESAANAFRKLIDQDRVVAIVGTVMSKCSLAGAPIAQAAKVPMISPTSTNPKVTLVGDYIFRACFVDDFQGTVMAKYAYEILKARKAGVLFDNGNDYNKGLAEFFKKSFEKYGGKVVAWEAFTDEDKTTDYSAQLTKIKATNPDVLFFPNYYGSAALSAKQARAMGLNAPILGGDGFDSPEFVKIGGAAVEGAAFSNHYSKEDPRSEVQNFIKNYKQRYGADPDALAVLAYDATLILFDGIKRAGKLSGAAIREAMAKTKGLKVVSGNITFDKDRNPVKSAVVLQIKGGQQVYIKTVAP